MYFSVFCTWSFSLCPLWLSNSLFLSLFPRLSFSHYSHYFFLSSSVLFFISSLSFTHSLSQNRPSYAGSEPQMHPLENISSSLQWFSSLCFKLFLEAQALALTVLWALDRLQHLLFHFLHCPSYRLLYNSFWVKPPTNGHLPTAQHLCSLKRMDIWNSSHVLGAVCVCVSIQGRRDRWSRVKDFSIGPCPGAIRAEYTWGESWLVSGVHHYQFTLWIILAGHQIDCGHFQVI